MPEDDSGFSLIELMVAVLIIAILLAVGLPVFLGARSRAQDRATHQMLTNSAKVEAALESDGGGYTADVPTLQAEEPALDWSGTDDDSIHVVVSVDSSEVLLYSRSNSGTWFGIRLSEGDRFTCSGGAEADVDALADCMGTDW